MSVATADETGGESGIGGLAVPAPDGEISPDAAQEFFESQSKSTVMVELQGDPVAVTEAKTEGSLSEAQEKDIESKLESDQGQVAKAIEAKGGQVEGQMQSAFNGMRVTIDNNELESLRSVPGVKAVHSIPVYERSNTASVPSLGVPKIWEGSGGSTGYTGEGVKVAVIDSGIDYTHATFGGPGTADAYQEQAAADAQDKPNPAWYGPDAPHVKGGVDFVGDDYNGKNQPKPDNNPLDCTKQGHGTHVAATLGGGGVLADGQAYSGSYDQKTHENEFKVGPGVAPKADLYAARVFGCTGYTTFIPEAIDWAVKNKMDVINLSIGAAFGKATDPGAIAAANAVASGVVVVAASGNSGEQPYITSEPGVGAGVISVAATDPSRDGGYGTFSSAGPRSGDSGLRPGVAAPGVNISSAAVGSGNDAKPRSGTSMATPQVAGVAALAVQAHPGWNAQEISSALVSTADPGKVSGYSPTRGGGLIDPTEATSAQVLAFGDSTDIDDKVVRDPVLSFGYHESNDTFQETRTITLVNKGSMSHSIDFHAGVLPPDDVMRSINPGESLVYEFTAQRAGIWLYHCSTAPMSVHLASGMHGAVIIDPPNLTAVDREYVVVQSEIYLGPEGGETDAVKVAAKTPDLFAFNGIAFQYRDRPFTARPGERVRFWVLDAGPSEPMSFHAVGLQFDQVFFEGAWTLGGPDRIGAAWSGGSQALGLHPAQGGFVECVPPAAGTYTVVSHSFADMEKGAMGHLVVAD